jgi:hypothetical protein
VDHFAWEVSYRDAKLLQDLAAIKRDPFPRHVTYKTPSLRYNKAYWLRIDAIDRGLALAEIDGERGDGTFAVRATNVGAFSLLLDPKDVPPARSITVTVDGATVYKGAPRPVLGFARAGGAWKPVDGSATPPALPQHAASGLFSRALARERAHLYVYGTGGRPEVTAANRALARAMADWGPGVRVRFPAKADSEVSAAELASHDLVLIGSARTNTLVRRMQLGERTTQGHDRLPIDDGADRLVAGALSLADADRSYRLACPNPLAPGRNVLIYGADSPAALARFDRFAKGNAAAWGPESNLDYVIWDGAGKVRASGVFRDRWKIGE